MHAYTVSKARVDIGELVHVIGSSVLEASFRSSTAASDEEMRLVALKHSLTAFSMPIFLRISITHSCGRLSTSTPTPR